MSAYLKILSTEQPVLPIFYYGRIAGWRAYLNPDLSTDDKKIIKRYEPPYIKIHEKDVQPGSTDELIYVPQPKKIKKVLLLQIHVLKEVMFYWDVLVPSYLLRAF